MQQENHDCARYNVLLDPKPIHLNPVYNLFIYLTRYYPPIHTKLQNVDSSFRVFLP